MKSWHDVVGEHRAAKRRLERTEKRWIDGRASKQDWFDACDLAADREAEYRRRFFERVTKALKRVYTPAALERAAMREHPLLAMVRRESL